MCAEEEAHRYVIQTVVQVNEDRADLTPVNVAAGTWRRQGHGPLCHRSGRFRSQRSFES